MLLFSGSSHPQLAQDVAKFLKRPLAALELGRFPDQEISIRIAESVRGQNVYVLQTIALDPNEYLMELLVIVDALKRASAGSITAVIPYFGYCRQDRKNKPREPVTAKLVADMLTVAGVNHLLTMDLHAGQLEGFFNIPVDHIHAVSLMAPEIQKGGLQRPVVVAPDIGSVKLAHSYARFLNCDFAIVDKQRRDVASVESVTLIGDVKGKDVLLADDMCSTAGTLVSAAKACQGKGASRIYAVVTHGILMGDAVERIEKSPIDALWISNTIPSTERLAKSTKIKMVSVASLLGHAISCIDSQESIASLSHQ